MEDKEKMGQYLLEERKSKNKGRSNHNEGMVSVKLDSELQDRFLDFMRLNGLTVASALRILIKFGLDTQEASSQ